MQGLILAAGRGSRLGALTDERPKCLVAVDGRTMLDRAIVQMREAGIGRIAVVVGYQGHLIEAEGVEKILNANWSITNIAASFMTAASFLRSGPTVICYADIVFDRLVLDAALHTSADVSVVVDQDWMRVYEGRDWHPIGEAEKVELRQDGDVAKIGKIEILPNSCAGEFIGMLKVTVSGAKEILRIGEKCAVTQPGFELRLGRTFEQAYLADLLQVAIDHGMSIRPSFINGGWREVDFSEDRERAEQWLRRQSA